MLVRNVHTGSHEDLRWAFDREQSNRGNQNSDNVDSAFIDSVLSKEFFSKYAEEDEETLRNQVLQELRQRYDYPKEQVSKDDLLYLVQRNINEHAF